MEMINDKDYTSITDKEVEEVISSLSDDVILSSIKDQIDNIDINICNTTYFLSYFATKYQVLLDKYHENDELCKKIKLVKQNLYMNIKSYMENKFAFTVEFPEYMTLEDQYNYITILYEFFVLRHQNNNIALVSGYIQQEFKSIIRHYKAELDKKDLTYTNMNKNMDKDMIVILCKLPEIIDDMQIDVPEALLNYIISEDPHEYDNSVILSLIEQYKAIIFGDNFVENALNRIKNNPSFYLYMRTELLNKELLKG